MGIVLAGVHVWRDGGLDSLRSLPMLPIANRPLIQYVFEWFKSAGITRIAVCLTQTESAAETSWMIEHDDDLELHLFFDTTPRGPAGCCGDVARVLTATNYIVSEIGLPPDINLAEFLTAHAESDAAVSLLVEESGLNSGSGERTGTPVGVMAFRRAALGLVPPTGYQDIKEVLIPKLRREGHAIQVVPATAAGRRMHGLQSYLAAQESVLGSCTREWSADEYQQDRGLRVHRTAELSANVRCEGSVLVGPGCRVMEGCVLVGPAVLGARSFVSERAVIGRTVLWDDCRIGAQSVLWNCVVADGTSVGSTVQRRGEILSGEV